MHGGSCGVCYADDAFHCIHAAYESSRALVCSDACRGVYSRVYYRIYVVYNDCCTRVGNDAFYNDVGDATGHNQS